jgi:exonuclease III
LKLILHTPHATSDQHQRMKASLTSKHPLRKTVRLLKVAAGFSTTTSKRALLQLKPKHRDYVTLSQALVRAFPTAVVIRNPTNAKAAYMMNCQCLSPIASDLKVVCDSQDELDESTIVAIGRHLGGGKMLALRGISLIPPAMADGDQKFAKQHLLFTLARAHPMHNPELVQTTGFPFYSGNKLFTAHYGLIRELCATITINPFKSNGGHFIPTMETVLNEIHANIDKYIANVGKLASSTEAQRNLWVGNLQAIKKGCISGGTILNTFITNVQTKTHINNIAAAAMVTYVGYISVNVRNIFQTFWTFHAAANRAKTTFVMHNGFVGSVKAIADHEGDCVWKLCSFVCFLVNNCNFSQENRAEEMMQFYFNQKYKINDKFLGNCNLFIHWSLSHRAMHALNGNISFCPECGNQVITNRLYTCDHCKKPRYCSPECQNTAIIKYTPRCTNKPALITPQTIKPVSVVASQQTVTTPIVTQSIGANIPPINPVALPLPSQSPSTPPSATKQVDPIQFYDETNTETRVHMVIQKRIDQKQQCTPIIVTLAAWNVNKLTAAKWASFQTRGNHSIIFLNEVKLLADSTDVVNWTKVFNDAGYIVIWNLHTQQQLDDIQAIENFANLHRATKTKKPFDFSRATSVMGGQATLIQSNLAAPGESLHFKVANVVRHESKRFLSVKLENGFSLVNVYGVADKGTESVMSAYDNEPLIKYSYRMTPSTFVTMLCRILVDPLAIVGGDINLCDASWQANDEKLKGYEKTLINELSHRFAINAIDELFKKTSNHSPSTHNKGGWIDKCFTNKFLLESGTITAVGVDTATLSSDHYPIYMALDISVISNRLKKQATRNYKYQQCQTSSLPYQWL